VHGAWCSWSNIVFSRLTRQAKRRPDAFKTARTSLEMLRMVVF